MSKLTANVRRQILHISSVFYHNYQSKLLFYHDVFGDTRYTDMGTPLSVFKEHINVIKDEKYTIVPKIKKESGEVAILFDDGFRGIYDVRQYFYDNNIRPTVFLAVSLIGEPGYLSKEEILELQEHGFIFECHAWSHLDLTTFNDVELERELKESKDHLSKLLGKDVTELCLPIGYYSDHLLEEIQKYGYNTIYSSVPGNYSEIVHGIMRARNLLQYADKNEVKYILRGGNSFLRTHYNKLHYRSLGHNSQTASGL